MKTQTLSNVTLQTIENYRNAATLAVDVYRASSHRLIKAVNEGVEKNVYSRTVKVAPQLTNRLAQFRGGLTDIIVKGVDGVSTGTEKAIEASSNTASKGVSKVAEFAAGIDNRVAVNGIEAVARFSLPGAQVALAVSARVAEGADKLSRVAGVEKAKVVRGVKTAKRKAVGAKRAVVRKATASKAAVTRKTAVAKRKAVAATKAPVARARRKVAAVAEAVAV
jgi:hypothetical protein